MQYRKLGRTGYNVSAVSFGAWAIGGSWGPVKDAESIAALHTAVDMGVNFFDTADVYGNGKSERLLAKLRRERSEEIIIATKIGRRSNPHTADSYNLENLTAYAERCLKTLDVEALDLVQLHCPPTDVYYRPEVFGVMDDLVAAGKIKHYGVSVEKVEEALKAIAYPNVATVQIIFNMFRHRPAGLFFEQAKQHNIGVLARVPLASGLLTGKMTPSTTFDADDHRAYNREGEAFDKGETFSGVPYDVGLKAVAELEGVCPERISMVQFALRWILMFDAVTCAIPGAKRPSQAEENFAAADLPALSDDTMAAVRDVYKRHIREYVHQLW
ncbi:MAG: aldo/keto reductase [Anaerolineae bacterium]|nr:aldo/keto reductase [Anaerolineae bacterium]